MDLKYVNMLYCIYVIVCLPTIIMSWYYGFPRGFTVSFVGVSFGCLILSYAKDSLVEDRCAWKEYFIGLLGLLFIPLIAIANGQPLYISLMDLYYLVIGITVFELSILPMFFFVDFDIKQSGYRLVAGIVLSAVFMLFVAYLLFIQFSVGVVH